MSYQGAHDRMELICLQFDYFHELIINQEIARCGARGYGDGLHAGCVIGLPPVLNFGSPELKARVVPEVLSAKKFICLAASEAYAGSDVFGLQTTATKTEDGKHWIITGTKKWITNGMYVPLHALSLCPAALMCIRPGSPTSKL